MTLRSDQAALISTANAEHGSSRVPRVAPWLALNLLAAAVGSAWAQGVLAPATAASAPASSTTKKAEEPATLQVVTVTAQKRLQEAQDVPISLYSVTGRTLEKTGIVSVEGLGNSVAGVSIGATNPGQLQINIRGVTDLAQDFQISPANGLYIDEAPLTGLAQAQPDIGLFDIDRVEVLRGPQGTLFGEGSMGGTIRIITRKPDASALFGRVSLGGSKTSGGGTGYNAGASLNVPLVTDTLAATVAVSRQKLPGWIDIPDLGKTNANSATKTDGRLALRWTPTSALIVDASFLTGRIDAGDYGATAPGVLDPVAAFPGAGPVLSQSSNYRRNDLSNLTVTYDFGAVTLVSASTYLKGSWDQNKDASYIAPVFFGPLGVNGSVKANSVYDVKAFTQEVRLSSNGTQTLNWTAGAYYKDGENESNGGFVFDLPNFIGGRLQDAGLSTLTAKNKAYAVFGDVDYALSRTWSVQAGLRYYSEDKQFTTRDDTSSAIFGTVSGTERGGSNKATATSPKLVLSWKPSADMTVFGKVSKGFRGGGANAVPAAYPTAPGGFGPETLTAYELGLKMTPARGWYLNAYLYRNQWKDLQLGFVTNDGLFSFTQNAGKASATGAELELGGQVVKGLNLGLSLAYVDAKIDEDVSDALGNLIAKKGNQIPFSSKTKVGLTADYSFAINEAMQASLTGRYQMVSKNFSEPANRDTEANGASRPLFLRAAIRRGDWELGLWGDNLLNRDDTSFKQRPISAIPLVFTTYVRPRTIGVDLKTTF